jgi:hypothetical protein
MKKLTLLLLVSSGILSGCIAYDAPYRDEPMHRSDHDQSRDRDYNDHHRGEREQDRDHDRDHDNDRR